MDTLSRLSHDSDTEVAMVCSLCCLSWRFVVANFSNLWIFFLELCGLCEVLCSLCCRELTIYVVLVQSATISLGLLGAGTNNARIAGMLRNLSSYYYKDPSLLFCVCLFFLASAS